MCYSLDRERHFLTFILFWAEIKSVLLVSHPLLHKSERLDSFFRLAYSTSNPQLWAGTIPGKVQGNRNRDCKYSYN